MSESCFVDCPVAPPGRAPTGLECVCTGGKCLLADTCHARRSHFAVRVQVVVTGGQGADAEPVERAGLLLTCALPAGLPASAASSPGINFTLQASRAMGAAPVRYEAQGTYFSTTMFHSTWGAVDFFLASKALDVEAWEPFLIDGRVRMSATVSLAGRA